MVTGGSSLSVLYVKRLVFSGAALGGGPAFKRVSPLLGDWSIEGTRMNVVLAAFWLVLMKKL